MTKEKIITEKERVSNWRNVIYDLDPNSETHHVDLVTHIMIYIIDAYKLGSGSEINWLTKTKANIWLNRVQSGSHFSHADAKITKVILDYHAQHNNTVKQMLGVVE